MAGTRRARRARPSAAPAFLVAAVIAVTAWVAPASATTAGSGCPGVAMPVVFGRTPSRTTAPSGAEIRTWRYVASNGVPSTLTEVRFDTRKLALSLRPTARLGRAAFVGEALESTKDGLVAVNGDYFTVKSGAMVGRTRAILPVGPMVFGGRATYLPRGSSQVFAITAEGSYLHTHIRSSGSVTGKTRAGERFNLWVSAVNPTTVHDSSGVVVQTGAAQFTRPHGTYEVLVRDGKVVKSGTRLTRVRSTDVVLAGRGESATALRTLSYGTSVQVDRSVRATKGQRIATAIGSGKHVLDNGTVSADCDATQETPRGRTFIAWKPGATRASLVTVVPSRTAFGGLTHRQVAIVARELGYTDAVQFDGGGSSVTAVRTRTGSHARIVNGSDDRRTPNVLMLSKR